MNTKRVLIFCSKAATVALLALILMKLMTGAEYLLLVLLAAMIHEAGHIVCAAVLKVPSAGKGTTFFGLSLKYDFSTVSYAKEAAVSAAGAVFNVLACVLSYYLFGKGTHSVFFIFSNLSLALFNLLPVSPLDGSGILSSVLSMMFNARAADRIVRYISASFSVVFFVFCVYVQLKVGANLSLMFISIILLYNSLRGIRFSGNKIEP